MRSQKLDFPIHRGRFWSFFLTVLLLSFLTSFVPVAAGPVSDLVVRAQQLHGQAVFLSGDPELPAQYPQWQTAFNDLSADIQAALPAANDGEYQAGIVSGLVPQLPGPGGTGCSGSGFGGPAPGSCSLNLQLQTGAYVLNYYLQTLSSDQALLESILHNSAQSH
ncbi:hypothetical protein [Gloeobacter kilaueensis]|uniref:Uncharacterized protein n=1 Tax=Gloeobacter kilaueensis (strain ATCC BAA-2537 / CCAP 1431/1 / ULC 316 / JS1) TaxID=1183438 RepID=U5QJV6_GLOK1|nr:hypothetical protein [Gloeobacter kilaueensis]AGY57940.1 hypothetical protein GKIL_1694 [Gloeobacter kilaueensis JS1]